MKIVAIKMNSEVCFLIVVENVVVLCEMFSDMKPAPDRGCKSIHWKHTTKRSYRGRSHRSGWKQASVISDLQITQSRILKHHFLFAPLPFSLVRPLASRQLPHSSSTPSVVSLPTWHICGRNKPT